MFLRSGNSLATFSSAGLTLRTIPMTVLLGSADSFVKKAYWSAVSGVALVFLGGRTYTEATCCSCHSV